MGLTAPVGGGDFEKAPEGTSIARCIKIIDLGTTMNTHFNKRQHKVRYVFELPNDLMQEGDYAGKPFVISKDYTLSMNEKANLRKDLSSWRGKSFTDEEAEMFDITKVISQPAMINIIHNEAGYANISSLMAAPKGMPCPQQINDSVVFILESPLDTVAYNSFHDRLKDKIAESDEYRELTGGQDMSNIPPANANHQAPNDFQDDDLPGWD